MSVIEIRGAHERNLQWLDVNIPLGQLVAVTGLSGSGKSSLAISILATAGLRRILDGYSPSLQRKLRRCDLPAVDSVTHVPPPIVIRWDHSEAGRSQQATVASLLDLEQPLLELFLSHGTLLCPQCQTSVRIWTAESIAAYFTELADRRKAMIGFPLTVDLRRRGPAALVQDGCLRMRRGDQMIDLTTLDRFQRGAAGEVIVDRLTTDPMFLSRWQESLEYSLRAGGGRCSVFLEGVEVDVPTIRVQSRNWSHFQFFRNLVCRTCQLEFPPLTETKWDEESPTSKGLRVHERNLIDLAELNLHELSAWIEAVWKSLIQPESLPLQEMMKVVHSRLLGAIELGLGHLQPGRSAATLSAGTCRRLLLMNAISRDLPDTLLIVEEPAAGMHSSQLPALNAWLRRPLSTGQSVVVVEHVSDVVLSADYIIELGPGAGAAGGRIVATGTPREVCDRQQTVTSEAWRRAILAPSPRSPSRVMDWFDVRGLNATNLPEMNLKWPVNGLTVVTGISGTGKSTLLRDVLPRLMQSAREKLPSDSPTPFHFQWESLSQPIALFCTHVTSARLSASPLSTVVTRLKVFDDIRTVFAETGDARRRGWSAAQFSFATSQGLRCPRCRGRGRYTIELSVIPDAETTCPDCGGSRYRSEVQAVRYRGLTIVDVLGLTVAEAMPVFRNHPAIYQSFSTLIELGLDYLVLGQPAQQLSGGEAQRIRLASLLTSRSPQPQAFLCDEPSSGLHPLDVCRLANCFRRLTELGHTVVIVDHQRELFDAADWIIELHRAADWKSLTVVQGTPQDHIQNSASLSGRVLSGARP